MKIRLKSDTKTLESLPCDRPLIVGRRDTCELPIDDRSVSRQHAELAFRKGDGWYLRDLGSRFGTQVNGLPISAPIRLSEGDHVTLGKLQFTVTLVSDEDTGYNTTGMAAVVPAALAPPPPRPASPALPGPDTSPVSRLAPENGTRSRKRIVRIPIAASIDSTVKMVAVLGFASVLLIVVALMLRGRGSEPLVKITREIPQGPIDRGTPGAAVPPSVAVAPVLPVAPAPPAIAAPAIAAVAPPETPPKRTPVRRAEADEETAPPAAAPARRTTVVRPEMPDGDLAAEKAADANPMGEMPRAGVAPATVPGIDLVRGHLAAQVQAGASLFWEVTINESSTRYTVRSADATGLRMASTRGEMVLTWDQLGNEGLYNLFQPLLPGSPGPVVAAWLRLGASVNRSAEPAYQQQLGALREKDPDAARAFEESMKSAASKPEPAGVAAVPSTPASATPPATAPPAATPPEATPVSTATPAGAAVPPAAPAAPKGWGEPGPELRPTLLMLARIGGTGDQWIKTVAVKGNIVAAAGEGDFQVAATIAPDGAVRAQVTGSITARHDPWGVLPPVQRARAAGGLEHGAKQVHPVLQQPYLVSGTAWKLWGWTYDQARTSKAPFAPFMADSGIRGVVPMPNGSLLVTGMSEGGNTSLRASPKDINAPMEFAIATGGGAGKSSFLFEVTPAGEPVRQMVLRGSANAACWDAWGRMLVAGRGLLRGAPNAFEYPDGAGILLADAGWQKILFGTSIGAEGDGDVSLVGIGIDPASGLAAAVGYVEGDIKQVRPIQEKAGGGKDGLLVIFSLWGSYGRPAAGGAK
jgi:hypothetical protein